MSQKRTKKKRLNIGAWVPSEDVTLKDMSTLVTKIYQQADWLSANAAEMAGWLQPEKENLAVETAESENVLREPYHRYRRRHCRRSARPAPEEPAGQLRSYLD